MKKIFLSAIIGLSLFGSDVNAMGKRRQEVNGTNYRVYRIKKGNHYSNGIKGEVSFKNTFNYTVIFDESAKYTTKDPVNQYDINKLIGFTDCGSLQIHKHSARFGWNWDNGALHIHAYTYANGVRSYEKIADAEIGKPMSYQIRVDGSDYLFTFNNKTIRMKRGCSGSSSLKTFSYPYFGGDETAPQEVKILIKM